MSEAKPSQKTKLVILLQIGFERSAENYDAFVTLLIKEQSQYYAQQIHFRKSLVNITAFYPTYAKRPTKYLP